MFAVKIDEKLTEHSNKIKYALDYLFETLGYSYRLLSEDERAKSEEILFFQVSDLQVIEEYLSNNPRGFAICVLYDELLYSEMQDINGLKDSLKTINIGTEVPYICSRSLNNPISMTSDTNLHRFYTGIFHFDLIGNIYFNLRGIERDSDLNRDSKNRYLFAQSIYQDYLDNPYLQSMLKLVELFINEGEDYLRYPILQKAYWPSNKLYAVAMSHTVSKLVKWNTARFFRGVWDNILTFWRVGYHWRNFAGFIRYLFTNWEPYWNFDLVSFLEHQKGIRSTFFYGVSAKTRYDIDYDISEPDLMIQKNELREKGHEFALLNDYNSVNEDNFQPKVEKLQEFTGSQVEGVRQIHYLQMRKGNAIYYSNGGLLWDSSWSMPDKQGFIHGIGYPFFLMDEKEQKHNVMEIPVMFNDSVMRHEKSYRGLEGIKTQLDNLIDSARRNRSMLILNFDVAAFEEIPYLANAFKWLMDRLGGDPSAWKASLSEINNWVRNRKALTTRVSGDIVEITSTQDIEEIRLNIKGLWRVNKLLGILREESEQEELDLFAENTWWQVDKAQVMVSGRAVKLENVKAGCKIKLRVEKFA